MQEFGCVCLLSAIVVGRMFAGACGPATQAFLRVVGLVSQAPLSCLPARSLGLYMFVCLGGGEGGREGVCLWCSRRHTAVFGILLFFDGARSSHHSTLDLFRESSRNAMYIQGVRVPPLPYGGASCCRTSHSSALGVIDRIQHHGTTLLTKHDRQFRQQPHGCRPCVDYCNHP